MRRITQNNDDNTNSNTTNTNTNHNDNNNDNDNDNNNSRGEARWRGLPGCRPRAQLSELRRRDRALRYLSILSYLNANIMSQCMLTKLRVV